MCSRSLPGFLLALTLLLASPISAEDFPGVDNADRARVNYMLNCQGCHGPDGAGTEDGVVPVMKNFVGHFLQTQAGREFLVRVPGSANAALSHGELAEVLKRDMQQLHFRVPQKRYDVVASLHRTSNILSETYEDGDVLISASVPNNRRHDFAAFLVD